MSARLSPEREAEIAARHGAATPGPWSASAQIGVVTNEAGDPLAVFGGGEQDRADAAFVAAAREDVPKLLAELTAVRAERDQARTELSKYVGKEPTIAEEMDYVSRCLNAVRDVCDTAEKQATRWENPLPVPEWVESVRAAANGERADNPNDNRRRLFVDGKGTGWISVCHDEGTEWIVPVQPEAAVEQDVRDVADETGSLREIGRCW